jgi:hypothetical protein
MPEVNCNCWLPDYAYYDFLLEQGWVEEEAAVVLEEFAFQGQYWWGGTTEDGSWTAMDYIQDNRVSEHDIPAINRHFDNGQGVTPSGTLLTFYNFLYDPHTAYNDNFYRVNRYADEN